MEGEEASGSERIDRIHIEQCVRSLLSCSQDLVRIRTSLRTEQSTHTFIHAAKTQHDMRSRSCAAHYCMYGVLHIAHSVLLDCDVSDPSHMRSMSGVLL